MSALRVTSSLLLLLVAASTCLALPSSSQQQVSGQGGKLRAKQTTLPITSINSKVTPTSASTATTSISPPSTLQERTNTYLANISTPIYLSPTTTTKRPNVTAAATTQPASSSSAAAAATSATTITTTSAKETRENPHYALKIRPQIKLTTNYTSVSEVSARRFYYYLFIFSYGTQRSEV